MVEVIRRYLTRRLVDLVSWVAGPALDRAARLDLDQRRWPDAG